jgi:hypothetical protein
MTEQPTAPKSSETDPPAANQPVGDDEATEPSQSNQPPAGELPVQPDPQVVPGKPDGEVDTRSDRGKSLG